MNREAIIAALTLLGWRPQQAIVFHVERGLQIGMHRMQVMRVASMRPFFASDGWQNFRTTTLQTMLEKIQAYDHEP